MDSLTQLGANPPRAGTQPINLSHPFQYLRAEMPGRRLFRVPVVGICICEALFKKTIL